MDAILSIDIIHDLLRLGGLMHSLDVLLNPGDDVVLE